MLRSTMRCSFCRRPDADVEKLVAGPWRLFAGRVYICDRCAALTMQIMEGSSGDQPRPETHSLFRRVLDRIAGKPRDLTMALTN
jgi:hypothetical protein